MVENKKLKQNKNKHKNTKHSKIFINPEKQILKLKDFNYVRENCNTNLNNIAVNLDSCSFTQSESMNINLNYTQSRAETPSIIENSINGNQTETPLMISKLILEKTITHVKIQCAISNYTAQIKSITDYKINPESIQIPIFLKFKIQNLLKSKLNKYDIQQDIERTLTSSLNFKQLKLLELENLNQNFVAHFWHESLLPALRFANYTMNYDDFISLYSSTLKNTKFEFFLSQAKHEIQKKAKIKKFEIIKEENNQQFIITNGKLNKFLKNLNQLSLKFNKTHLDNQKLKSKINSREPIHYK